MRHIVARARHSPDGRLLTYHQYVVLRAIMDDVSPVQTQAARRLVVGAPVVTRVVNSLVGRGLARRGSDSADGRVVKLVITPAGRRAEKAMSRALLSGAAELLQTLRPVQRKRIAVALDELKVLLPTHDVERERHHYAPRSRDRADPG
jgi:DNA-binding MarR family transcriptional regulator